MEEGRKECLEMIFKKSNEGRCEGGEGMDWSASHHTYRLRRLYFSSHYSSLDYHDALTHCSRLTTGGRLLTRETRLPEDGERSRFN